MGAVTLVPGAPWLEGDGYSSCRGYVSGDGYGFGYSFGLYSEQKSFDGAGSGYGYGSFSSSPGDGFGDGTTVTEGSVYTRPIVYGMEVALFTE